MYYNNKGYTLNFTYNFQNYLIVLYSVIIIYQTLYTDVNIKETIYVIAHTGDTKINLNFIISSTRLN